jgi:predicted helicase
MSAIELVLDRYQVKIGKDCGTKNAPNDWVRESKEPRYILQLILRLIVGVNTVRIIKNRDNCVNRLVPCTMNFIG